MKKHTFFATALVTLLLGASVEAAPYAGIIRTSSESIIEGDGLTITYYLPYAATTSTIKIKDLGDTVIATFPGTVTSGLNTIVWNGTDDNASGSVIGSGSYKVEITVDRTAAAGWTIEAVNGSSAGPGSFFSGFSPNGVTVQNDQDSNLFGYLLTRASYSIPVCAAIIVLTPDLVPETGDGYASRVNRTPEDVSEVLISDGGFWGAALVPGTDNIFGIGQGVTKHFLADNSAGLATNVVSVTGQSGQYTLDAFSIRDIAISNENGTNYGYLSRYNSFLTKFSMDAEGWPTSNNFNVFALTDTKLYSRSAVFDRDGNLYWVCRSTSGSGYGFLYRWDAATVKAIQTDTDTKLNELSATWKVDFAAVTDKMMQGVTITPDGDVYAVTTDTTIATTMTSVFYVGNTSTATLTKSVTNSMRVISLPEGSNGIYGGIFSDAGGNLITINRSAESITMISPGGTSTITTHAPPSQNFEIIAGVEDWYMTE